MRNGSSEPAGRERRSPADTGRVSSSRGWWTALALLVAVAIGGGGCEYLGLSKAPSDESKSASEDEDQGAESTEDEKGKKAKKDEKTAAELAGKDEQPSQTQQGGETGGEDEEGRNPFEPKIQLDRQQREQSKDEKKKETIENPLERYTLKQLRLAGIISGVPVPKGLFIDPEGVGHLVKEGDRIGKEGGKVDDVRPDEVVVRIPAGETDEKVRTRTVELAKSELPTKRRQGLTEKQREMLKKLRRSRQGRRALKESYEDISGRGAGRPRRRRRGTSPRRRQPTGDQRFPGLAPPEQEQQQ